MPESKQLNYEMKMLDISEIHPDISSTHVNLAQLDFDEENTMDGLDAAASFIPPNNQARRTNIHMLNDESDFIDSSREDNEDQKSTEAPKKDMDQFMPDNDPVEEIAPFTEAE